MIKLKSYRKVIFLIIVISIALLFTGISRAETDKNEDSQGEMPFDLNVTVIAERPDMAKAMKAQIQGAMTKMMARQGVPLDPEMMKFEIWVYEIKEGVEDALIDYDWPPNTGKTPLATKTIDDNVNEILNNPDVDIEGIFGEEWSERARKAAKKYKGVEITTKSFSFLAKNMKSYSIQVMSPCFNMETFKLNKGTVLTIAEVSINMESLGIPSMGD